MRLHKKASTYAQDIVADDLPVDAVNGNVNSASCKIDVDGVVDLYESYIIPLTKEVEVKFQDLIPCYATDVSHRLIIYLIA